MNKTRLVVFDLDFTLWDCGGTWCDCTCPPYEKNGDSILDAAGHKIRLYPHVMRILDECAQNGVRMALASRTDAPELARELLALFQIDSYFQYQEIYPGDKQKHLKKISNDSGIVLEDIVFFDDEMRNITSTQSIGVNAVWVSSGINNELFSQHCT